MPSLATIMLAWSILAPLATFGFMKSEMWVHDIAASRRQASAVTAARSEEQKQCTARIGAIAKDSKDAVDKGVREALAAASKLSPTPEGRADIVSLCNRSVSCRDRQK